MFYELFSILDYNEHEKRITDGQHTPDINNTDNYLHYIIKIT